MWHSSYYIKFNRSIQDKFYLTCKLTVIQLGVEPAFFQKFLMASLLHDVPIAHDKDLIRLPDGGKAVRHDEGGAAAHEAIKRFLHLEFGARIDGGGRLVENQHGRAAQHDARNAEKLLLPLRKAAAVLGDERIVSLRQAANEAVRMACLGSLDHLVVRRVRTAHLDIFADSTRFQPGFLQHHAVAAAQASARDGADILAFHSDGAAAHIIKAHEQIDERCLAAAGWPDNGDALARLHGKVQSADQRTVRIIGEGDVLQGHMALHIGENSGVRLLRHLRFLLDQIKNAARAGKGVLQLRDHAGNFIERFRVLVCIAEQAGEIADSDAAADRHQRAREADAGIDHAVHEARGRVCDGGKEGGAQRIFGELVIDLVKLIERRLLVRKGLHRLLAANHLVDDGCLTAARFGLQLEHGIRAARDEARHEERDRREQHHHERDARVNGEHEAQCAQNGDNACEKLREAHEKAVRKLIHIRNHTAHNLAVRVRVEIFERQNLNSAERLVAHVTHHLIGDLVVDGVHEPLEQRRDGDNPGNPHQQGGDPREIHLARAEDEVDRLADEDGNIEGERHRDGGEQNGEREQEAVPLQAAEHFAERLHLLAVRSCHVTHPPF